MRDEIIAGSRWRSRGGGFVVEVMSIRGSHVMYRVPISGSVCETGEQDFRDAYTLLAAPEPASRETPAHDPAADPVACRRCKDGGDVAVLDTDLEPSVLCLRCGNHGPRCDDAAEAVETWNKGQGEMDVKTFASGANRSLDAESTRYDLVSPIGLRRLAETYAEGAGKYGPGNWLKGIPASDLLNHLMKHVDSFRMGDKGEDHLAHAAWGLFALMHFEETRPDMMDQISFAAAEKGAAK